MTLRFRIISRKVRKILERDSLSIIALMNKIASPRKIARRILPEVSKELGFEPCLSTVSKVVERYVKEAEEKGKFSGYDAERIKEVLSKTHVMVRSDVSALGVRMTKRIGKKLTRILEYVYSRKEKPFVNITFGHSYITLIIDQCNLKKAIQIIVKKNLVYSKKNQAASTSHQPP